MDLDPHAAQPVLRLGPTPAASRLTLILVHGRGASAEDILGVAHELEIADIACLAPQAASGSWYPYSFLMPIEQNEPRLTSALNKLDAIINALGADGITPDRIALLGFSQGACLSLEYAARHARRYAAILGLSGGVIGPPGTPRNYDGSLDGTPAFLGCSDIDPHIPLERVHETADLFRRMDATVEERIYPRMGHTINRDEIEVIKNILRA